MTRKHTITFYVPLRPSRLLELAADPKVFTRFWRFVESIDLGSMPFRIVFKFRKFGFTGRFDYEVTVRRGEGRVSYVGEARGRRFEVTVEAVESNSGSQVTLTVSYSGPYESFSQSFLRELAEGIVRGLTALAEAEGRGKAEGRLKDASYLARLMATCRMLARRTLHVGDELDLQTMFAVVYQLSAGRTVFARARAGDVVVRMLARDGKMEDIVLSSPAGVVEGAAVFDVILGALKGRDVEILVFETPEE